MLFSDWSTFAVVKIAFQFSAFYINEKMSQSQVAKMSKVRSVQLAMRHPNLTVAGRNTGLETHFTRRKKLNFNIEPSSGAVLGK